MDRVPCHVRVTTRDGRPLAGVNIVVEHATAPVPELAYTTGPDGIARIGLPTGPTKLGLSLPDGRRHTASLMVGTAPEQTHEVQVDDN